MPQGKAFDKKKVLENLEHLFRLGYSRYKACKYSGFDESLLSKWEKADPTLSLKINGWIAYPSIKAREVILKSIQEDSVKDAQWWAERVEKDDFSTKSETEQSGTITIKKIIEGSNDKPSE